MLAIFTRSVIHQAKAQPDDIPADQGPNHSVFRMNACLVLLAMLLAGNLAAETPVALQYAGGDGSQFNPWQISNLAELRLLSETPDDWVAETYFIVTADINAADTINWNAGLGFFPIGKIGGIPFAGDFEGDDKVISNLLINRPTQQQVGLFGGIKNAAIRNVHLSGFSITGKDQVGGLAGKNLLSSIDSSTTTSCTVSAVEGEVGGLVGNLDAGTITSSRTSGGVATTGSSVGGLVGSTYLAAISLSSSSATVSGGSEAGGLVGYFSNSTLNGTNFATGDVDGVANIGGLLGKVISPTSPLDHAYASGVVSGTTNVGGLVGYTEFLTITHSHAVGEVIGIGTSKQLGGLVGNAINSIIEDSYATGNVSGVESVGGLVGDDNGGGISRCYASGQVMQSSAEVSLGFFGGLVGIADSAITSSTAKGSVSAANHDNVGGLVGYLGSGQGAVDSSYATGAVNGNDVVGGLIGFCNGGYVTSTYATGVTTGVGLGVGALLGNNFNCLNSGLPSFWLDPTGSTVGVGSGPAGGAVGLSPAATLIQNSFALFDFPATWKIIEGATRPYLAWQPSPLLIFSTGFEAKL